MPSSSEVRELSKVKKEKTLTRLRTRSEKRGRGRERGWNFSGLDVWRWKQVWKHQTHQELLDLAKKWERNLKDRNERENKERKKSENGKYSLWNLKKGLARNSKWLLWMKKKENMNDVNKWTKWVGEREKKREIERQLTRSAGSLCLKSCNCTSFFKS